MMPPCFSFHAQTRSRNFSRPRSSRCLISPAFFERLLDDRLRGDAGVVGAGQPEDFLAVHARLAGEDVLDGVVEDVAHVSMPVTFGGGMTME